MSALTLGQVNNKSMTGTIRLSDSEADHIIITSGLAVFMRAYALSPPEALLLVAPPLTVSLAPRRSAPNSYGLSRP